MYIHSKSGLALLTLVILTVIIGFAVYRTGRDSHTNMQEGVVTSEEDTQSNLGNHHIEIAEWRLVYDYDNAPLILVKYRFTNGSSESVYFADAFRAKVYQNDVALTERFYPNQSVNSTDAPFTNSVAAGGTTEIELAYILNDTDTDIEVEIVEVFGLGRIEKTFRIGG